MKKQKILGGALAVLVIFSNSALITMVMSAYQADYPKPQHYDVGLVLGGFSGLNKRNNKIAFGGSSDRLFQAIALYKENRVDQILLSSGNANLIENKVKEADLAMNYLKLIGIPDSAILIENQSRNTIENARNSIRLIQKIKPKAKILVITSAWHIPRAKVTFDRQMREGIEYYPTDFAVSNELDPGDYIIPSVSAMGTWEMLFKEWIGLVVDRFRN